MENIAENTVKKQRGKPFGKGVSGNPNGKAKGTKHYATQLLEQLFDDGISEVAQQVLIRQNLVICKPAS